jgi:hypothetical protein
VTAIAVEATITSTEETFVLRGVLHLAQKDLSPTKVFQHLLERRTWSDAFPIALTSLGVSALGALLWPVAVFVMGAAVAGALVLIGGLALLVFGLLVYPIMLMWQVLTNELTPEAAERTIATVIAVTILMVLFVILFAGAAALANSASQAPAPPTGPPPTDVPAPVAGPKVISGHGGLAKGGPAFFTLGDGQYVTFYTRHATSMTDALGNALETGGDVTQALFPEDSLQVQRFGPGDVIHNYTLSAPNGLNILGNPITVTDQTLLSDLLAQNGPGEYIWAACRGVAGGR